MSVHDQRAFATRIRRGADESLPNGTSAERMAVYEELFFNNLDGFVTSGFPLLCRILGEMRRLALVRDFLAEYRCHTPYFLDIGGEFVEWLEQGGGVCPGDPPFLAELAHYERVELALDVASEMLPEQGWSALAWPLAYAWPVHRISDDYQPTELPAEPTCLLAWRDGADRVRFQQLSPFAYHLALRLQAGEPSLEALLDLAESNGLPADRQYFAQTQALLQDWQQQDIWFL